MHRVRVGFIGFWPGFSLEQFLQRHPYLSLLYKLEEDNTDPDVWFVSVFSTAENGRLIKHRNADEVLLPDDGATKVFYTSEWIEPNFQRFDWTISFLKSDCPKNLYLPNWVPRFNYHGYRPRILLNQNRALQTEPAPGFCAFVYRNSVPFRESFFHLLNKIGQVDAPGHSCKNHASISGSANAKLKFLSNYRYAVSFENEIAPGYLTEKIVDAYIAGCVPIYMGDPFVEDTFDTESFLHVTDPSDYGSALERIRVLESDPKAYLKMLNTPPLKGDRLPDWATEDYALDFFDRIFRG